MVSPKTTTSPPLPKFGDEWGGYRLRRGQAGDAAAVLAWRDPKPDHQASLKNAAEHLRRGDGECYVVEASGGDVIGVLTIHECYLNFVYLVRGRGQRIAKRAAIVLIDHFFRDSREEHLIAGPPISSEGRRLLASVGFVGDRLSRTLWIKLAPTQRRVFATTEKR